MIDVKIKKVYIELTSACNLNCSICFRNSWIDEKQCLMSVEVLEKVYESLAELENVETVMFAGMGEPLLHDRICDIVDKVSQLGMKTEIVTNGTLLTSEIAECLIKSGLAQVWVSADDSHMKSSGNDVFVKNIKNFVSV